MNTKILVSLLVIGLTAIAIGGTMTGAFFSDTETSNQNTFAAGEIDLTINSECHYNGNVCEGGFWVGQSPYPVAGTPCDCTWLAEDLEGKPILNFADIKPGDEGESTISLHVTSNPAWVCAKISNLANADNGCNEPEMQAETADGRTATCDNPGVGQGELQDVILFNIWRDYDCENDFDEGVDAYLVQGAKATDLVWPIADSGTGTAVQPNVNYCIAVAWSVPAETGNIIQTDSITADISFEAVQERHNPNFVCSPVQDSCGNQVVEGDEVCDGNSQSCETNGYPGTQACNGQCSGWNDCITELYCGDGAINGNEECDDANTDNTDTCLNTCVTAVCGDGYVQAGVEQCDDGNTESGDGCFECHVELCKADIVSVLDKSGSIDATELGILKDAAHAFVTALDPKTDGAHMGQTSFATAGSLDLHLTSDKTEIDAAIDAIVSGGATNLYEGLLYANQDLADPSYDRDDTLSPDYMVVITDGDPNVPGTIENARNVAKAQADAADSAGTKIFVVGVGVTPDTAEWLKENIATDSTYYFAIANYSDLETVLQTLATCN